MKCHKCGTKIVNSKICDKNFNQAVKIKIAVSVVFCMLIFVLGACSSGNVSKDTLTTNENTEQTSTDIQLVDNRSSNEEQSTEAEQSTESEQTTEENQYAEDNIVNKFITEFNASSQFEITDISKGNIRTKYFGYANDCYIEMINATGAVANSFEVTINGGNSNEATEKMFETFPEFIHVLDSSITDEQIEQAITDFKTDNHLKSDYQLGDTLTITFVPFLELSNGVSRSRLDISSSAYGK